MLPSFLTAIFSRLALWWLEELFMAHRMAAIVNMNCLKKLAEPIGDKNTIAINTVIESLSHEILAVEMILGITSDD